MYYTGTGDTPGTPVITQGPTFLRQLFPFALPWQGIPLTSASTLMPGLTCYGGEHSCRTGAANTSSSDNPNHRRCLRCIRFIWLWCVLPFSWLVPSKSGQRAGRKSTSQQRS